MTFELSSEQLSVREHARALAARVEPVATDIDRRRQVSQELRHAMHALPGDGDRVSTVVAVEEVAVASGAVALWAAASAGAESHALTGLVGGPMVSSSLRAELVLAAVAVGVGRRALDEIVANLKASARSADDVEKPHWVVADAATELDAARLVTYQAALSGGAGDAAIARLLANRAASGAVSAALRVFGPAALAEGATLERITRDVRALEVVLGTEDALRATVAAARFAQPTL